MRTIFLASVASVIASANMSGPLDTLVVKVKGNSNGPVRINASDFDDTIHTLDDKATGAQPDAVTNGTVSVPPGAIVPPAPSAPNFAPAAVGGQGQDGAVAPDVPSPNSLLVMKKGSKYHVVYTNGEPVTGNAAVDVKGYASEALALEAIRMAGPGVYIHAPADPAAPAAA